MKQGISIQDMARELERQMVSKKDYIANNMALEAILEEDKVKVKGLNGNNYALTDYAHGQLATSLGIPKKYYDKMRAEEPNLLLQNANTWLKKNPDKKSLVRVLDGNIRGVLSDSYRPLDNYDLVETVLPIMQEKQCLIRSCAITETKLYIKASLPSMSSDLPRKVGDTVEAGIVISNSEVGAGAVKIEPMILRLVCLNGLIVPDRSLRKYHVGKGLDQDIDMSILTTETRQADDKAFWLKVRDIVKSAFSKELFNAFITKMSQTSENAIVNPNVAEVVDNYRNNFKLSESAGHAILRHLIAGNDLTQFGMINATTRASQDLLNYEEATELERLGGKVIELSRKDWEYIAA